MITWLVTWIVVSTFHVPCPQPEAVIDEFGMGGMPSTVTTLQACYETSEKAHSKEFASYREAAEFIEKAKKLARKEFHFNDQYIKNIELKEIKVME